MKRQDFSEGVYRLVAEIPSGKVATYGQLALLMGSPKWARRVGYAMHHAPAFLGLPCHRVVNGQGHLVPGWEEQGRLLRKEGVTFRENGTVDIKQNVWQPVQADNKEG